MMTGFPDSVPGTAAPLRYGKSACAQRYSVGRAVGVVNTCVFSPCLHIPPRDVIERRNPQREGRAERAISHDLQERARWREREDEQSRV